MAIAFDTPIDRRDTGSSKWSRYPANILPMWVADMDFAVAPEIIAAIEARLRHPVLGYSVARPQLREQIVGDMARKYGWTVRPDDIVFLPGVEPGFNMAIRALLQPDQKLAIQTPIYAPILKAPGNWRLEAVPIPVAAPLETQLDALRTADALLLCNPHNPTGAVLDAETLRRYADALGARPIIADEIHCDILYDGRRHVPIASIAPEIAARTITLMSASKTYNIAGLKTAFAIVPDPARRERFNAARGGMVDSVNALGLEATLAAYRDADAWRGACLAYLEGNRDFLAAALAERLPAIRMQPPAATFLAWLDCRALGLADPYRHFLDHARVAFSAGAEFGPAYGQFVRLNFGCSRSLLEACISRMEASLPARAR